MPPVIRISESLYQRLSAHAQGFDTPANVIERLLDQVEGVSPGSDDHRQSCLQRPELHFFPSEDRFRKGLIDGRTGQVVLHYADGSREDKPWQASRFTERSNLRANIWSGLLRGWEEKQIVSAEFHMK